MSSDVIAMHPEKQDDALSHLLHSFCAKSMFLRMERRRLYEGGSYHSSFRCPTCRTPLSQRTIQVLAIPNLERLYPDVAIDRFPKKTYLLVLGISCAVIAVNFFHFMYWAKCMPSVEMKADDDNFGYYKAQYQDNAAWQCSRPCIISSIAFLILFDCLIFKT
jgi:hypothetical protein